MGGSPDSERYTASIFADVWVEPHPDSGEEYQRALDAIYSKLYEGDAGANDGTLAFVKMNFNDLKKI